MSAILRKALPEDRRIIREMFYLAIFVPEGEPAFPRSIVEHPDLLKYHEQWGRTGDLGLIAEEKGEAVGAVWSRLFDANDPGYGFVASGIPELSMAVHANRRGKGIGSRLLRRHLDELRRAGFAHVSLSVVRANPALGLYRKFGFAIEREEGDSVTMVLGLSQPR